MSIAILPMASEYNWNSTTVGLIQSSFFWGYLLTQVHTCNLHSYLPIHTYTIGFINRMCCEFIFSNLCDSLQIAGGIWADTVGGKRVLAFGVVWWSVATILTPVAAKIGLPFLLVVRALMGVGEVHFLCYTSPLFLYFSSYLTFIATLH